MEIKKKSSRWIKWEPPGPERIKEMVLACSKKEVFDQYPLLVNILAYFNKAKEVKRIKQRASLAIK